MNPKFYLILATLFLSVPVHADVWKWVDAKGDTHFVDTDQTIYTWLDESGKVYYADTPGDDSAVSVELIWVSEGTLQDVEEAQQQPDGGSDDFAFPGETEADREERKQAEAYYCKRAQEVYESYLHAPKLYKTAEDGTRMYLSDVESKQTIDDTKARVDELCK